MLSALPLMLPNRLRKHRLRSLKVPHEAVQMAYEAGKIVHEP